MTDRPDSFEARYLRGRRNEAFTNIDSRKKELILLFVSVLTQLNDVRGILPPKA